jgi:predicted nucleotidyltransferase
MTFQEALQILASFERHGVAYVLVGSMAMAAQGVVRATRDIDVFVSPDEPNVVRLRAALKDVFADPSIDSITAADLAGEYPAIQYVPPVADYWIDILARLGDAWRYPDVESEILRVEGVSIRVATPRMLHRMKKDTVRPQDRVDAQLLKERFGLEDD